MPRRVRVDFALDQEIGGAREVGRQNAREDHPPNLSHDDCSLRCGGGPRC
jgi:hypothetical protein